MGPGRRPDPGWRLVEAAAAASGDEARRLLTDAEIEAPRSVAERPDDIGRRFGLAVVLGSRADIEGGRTKIRAASELYTELEAILEVDPEHARARHLLGRLHAGVKRMNRVVRWVATRLLGGEVLAGASWEAAERHLAFAAEHEPAVLAHHLQLANLYRDTGRPERALDALRPLFEREPDSALDRAVIDEALSLQAELDPGS